MRPGEAGSSRDKDILPTPIFHSTSLFPQIRVGAPSDVNKGG